MICDVSAEAATITDSPPSSAPEPGVGLWPRMAFTAARGFCWGFAVCFSLRGLYLFGQCFGTLEWLINYKRRRRFALRLQQLWGEKLTTGQRLRQSRRFFMRSRCDKVFYLILDKLPREKVLARFHVPGAELMDRAMERSRGCFVAMSHHGAQHLSAMLMALRGYRVAGVRDRNEGGVRRYVRALHDRRHPELGAMRVLFADAYPRDIYRCFRENYALGAALDVQQPRGERKRTVRVKLFGQERDFLVGTLQIALRCGAVVVQGFVISQKNFHYRLDLLGPLADGSQATESPQTLGSVMQAYAENIERYVRQYPCHVSRV